MQQGQSNIKCEFSRSTYTQAQLTDGKPLGIFFRNPSEKDGRVSQCELICSLRAILFLVWAVCYE